MRQGDDGDVLLVLALLVTGVVLAGAMTAPLAVLAVLGGSAQAAADAAALAGAQAVRGGLRGGDAAVWGCDEVPAGDLAAAVREVAAANAATVAAVRQEGCDVVVDVARSHRLSGTAPRVRASARARVHPGSRPLAGGAVLDVPGAPLARGSLLQALIAEADRIDRLRLPYVWGGGHQSSPAPPDGPFDCSGAVSRLLQSVGYPIPTLTSGQFTRLGRPGPGLVTIWAYDGHVFLTIAGRGWGTGSRPNGGAGWLPYSTPYHGRFVARHLPELEDPTVRDLTGLQLGTALAGAGWSVPTVALVADG